MIVSKWVFAWGVVGHRVVAQIAYDQLTPKVRANVEALTRKLDGSWRVYSFSQSANWPDWLLSHDVTAFSSWHYINLGYAKDGLASQAADAHHVVWAIDQAINVLQSQRSSDVEKALFLRFLIHFVGDIHQPLHCIDLYSAAFPNGDRGGNLFLIQDAKSKNLHQFWDRGLNYFDLFYKSYPRHAKQIEGLASQIENRYPRSSFSQLLAVTDAKAWSQESYQLAKKSVYNIELGSKPNSEYISKGQTVVGKQLALAGYRLGDLLNRLMG